MTGGLQSARPLMRYSDKRRDNAGFDNLGARRTLDVGMLWRREDASVRLQNLMVEVSPVMEARTPRLEAPHQKDVTVSSLTMSVSGPIGGSPVGNFRSILLSEHVHESRHSSTSGASGSIPARDHATPVCRMVSYSTSPRTGSPSTTLTSGSCGSGWVGNPPLIPSTPRLQESRHVGNPPSNPSTPRIQESSLVGNPTSIPSTPNPPFAPSIPRLQESRHVGNPPSNPSTPRLQESRHVGNPPSIPSSARLQESRQVSNPASIPSTARLQESRQVGNPPSLPSTPLLQESRHVCLKESVPPAHGYNVANGFNQPVPTTGPSRNSPVGNFGSISVTTLINLMKGDLDESKHIQECRHSSTSVASGSIRAGAHATPVCRMVLCSTSPRTGSPSTTLTSGPCGSGRVGNPPFIPSIPRLQESRQVGNPPSNPSTPRLQESRQVGNPASIPSTARLQDSRQVGNPPSIPSSARLQESRQVGNPPSIPSTPRLPESGHENVRLDYGEDALVKSGNVSLPSVRGRTAVNPRIATPRSPRTAQRSLTLSPRTTPKCSAEVPPCNRQQPPTVRSAEVPPCNRQQPPTVPVASSSVNFRLYPAALRTSPHSQQSTPTASAELPPCHRQQPPTVPVDESHKATEFQQSSPTTSAEVSQCFGEEPPTAKDPESRTATLPQQSSPTPSAEVPQCHEEVPPMVPVSQSATTPSQHSPTPNAEVPQCHTEGLSMPMMDSNRDATILPESSSFASNATVPQFHGAEPTMAPSARLHAEINEGNIYAKCLFDKALAHAHYEYGRIQEELRQKRLDQDRVLNLDAMPTLSETYERLQEELQQKRLNRDRVHNLDAEPTLFENTDVNHEKGEEHSMRGETLVVANGHTVFSRLLPKSKSENADEAPERTENQLVEDRPCHSSNGCQAGSPATTCRTVSTQTRRLLRSPIATQRLLSNGKAPIASPAISFLAGIPDATQQSAPALSARQPCPLSLNLSRVVSTEFPSMHCSPRAINHPCDEELLLTGQFPPVKLIVFDFDSTLSAFHVFQSLAGNPSSCKLLLPPPHAITERGQLQRLAELDTDPEWGPGVFALKAFGGKERVAQLREALEALAREGVECIVCSHGYVGPIRKCLDQVNLLTLFSQTLGSLGSRWGTSTYDDTVTADASINQEHYLGSVDMDMKGAGSGSKSDRIATCLETRGLKGCQAIFLDDDISEVRKSNVRAIHVAGDHGIGEAELKELRVMIDASGPCENAPTPVTATPSSGSSVVST